MALVDEELGPEAGKCGCPVEKVLRLLLGRWTLYILWRLSDLGPQRFNALVRLIPGVSPKVLTERLKVLERAELISRHYEPTVPPQVTYSVTEKGAELHRTLDEIVVVSTNWVAEGWTAEAGFSD